MDWIILTILSFSFDLRNVVEEWGICDSDLSYPLYLSETPTWPYQSANAELFIDLSMFSRKESSVVLLYYTNDF